MKPCITSEYQKIKKLLLHTPDAEHQQLIPWEGDHELMGPDPRSYHELQKDHATLKNYISDEVGAENVLELSQLLKEIFADNDYHFRYKVLADTLHTVVDTYVDHLQARGHKLQAYPAAEIVKDLIQGYPRTLTLNNGRLPKIIIPPKREMMWMRDSSITTPCGVMISSMANPRRMAEPSLLRTVFKYHPMFDPDSIFLDMVQFHREMEDDPTWSGLYDKYLIEGGDVIILSENTIAIGVGRHEFYYSNRTTRHGFYEFVRKIFEADPDKKIERIYLVNVPDLKGFIHLDTVFNMFGPRSAIVMPYIFGYPRPSDQTSAKDVLQHFVKWLRRNMGVKRTDLSKMPTEEHFEHAGQVEVYDRDYIEKLGRIERLPQPAKYFLDQLIDDGLLELDRVCWIGGNPDDYPTPYEHLKVALFDQHNMAGNVFTTQPFHVVTYHRNPVSIHSLEDKMTMLSSDTHIEQMSSNEIRTDDGGPRCLVMPLEREKKS